MLYAVFQSTLLREERQNKTDKQVNFTWFQSTLLREEREDVQSEEKLLFQSTLLREERRHFDINGNYMPISIHAPTRGRRRIR